MSKKNKKAGGLKYNAGDKFRQTVGGIRRTYVCVAVIGGNGLPGTPLFQLELVGRARLGDQVFLTLTEGQIDSNLALVSTEPGTNDPLPQDEPTTKRKEVVTPEIETDNDEVSKAFKDLQDELGTAEIV
mgnify:CR=1 FL=1